MLACSCPKFGDFQLQVALGLGAFASLVKFLQGVRYPDFKLAALKVETDGPCHACEAETVAGGSPRGSSSFNSIFFPALANAWLLVCSSQ